MPTVGSIIGGSFDAAVLPLANVEVIGLGDREYPAKLTALHIAIVQAFNGSLTVARAQADTATTKAGVATTQAGIATTQAGVATTQAGIATTQAGIATTQATTATTQAGIATTQAGTATTQAGIATTQAGIATSQASTATTQAGIATTQAGTATTQAGVATAQANLAQSWAISLTVVSGGLYGAQYYAQQAQGYASTAQAAAASAAASSGLPILAGVSDAGKALIVNPSGTAYILGTPAAPAITSLNRGSAAPFRLIAIDASGNIVGEVDSRAVKRAIVVARHAAACM